MTIYDFIKSQLEKYENARERKNKNRFIAWLLCKKYPTSTGMAQNEVENMITDSWSYDRAWRQVLQHEPQLRGADYSEKDIVEQEKELELGYQPKIAGDNIVKSL